MPQPVDDLRRAVAYGLTNGKTNMIADLAPLHGLLVANDTLTAVCRAAHTSLGEVMAELVTLDADATVNVCAGLELVRRQLAGAVAKAERGG